MGLTESRQPRRVISSAFLSRPITKIHSTNKRGKYVTHAMSCMQGWRSHMEDAHILMDSLQALDGWSFYSVLDGHAGEMAAKVSEELFGATVLYEVLPVHSTIQGVQGALKRAFIKHDMLLRHPGVQRDHSGTTCTSVLITPHYYVFANIGDSRTILCREGRLEFASHDHKPTLPVERTRIMRAGGCVLNGRVDGGLAVSRCFGDFDYKRRKDLPWLQQKVSPEPDVCVVERHHEADNFLLLACDGIWDVMTNGNVLKFVYTRLKQGKLSIVAICEALIKKCLDLGSRDNMSVVIVLLHGTHEPQQIVVSSSPKQKRQKQKDDDEEVALKQEEQQEQEEEKDEDAKTDKEVLSSAEKTSEQRRQLEKKTEAKSTPKQKLQQQQQGEGEESKTLAPKAGSEAQVVMSRRDVIDQFASSVAHNALESAVSDICDGSVPIGVEQGRVLDEYNEDDSESSESSESEDGVEVEQLVVVSTKDGSVVQGHHHSHRRVLHRTSSIGPRIMTKQQQNSKGATTEDSKHSYINDNALEVVTEEDEEDGEGEEGNETFAMDTIAEEEEGEQSEGEDKQSIDSDADDVDADADVNIASEPSTSTESSSSNGDVEKVDNEEEENEIIEMLGERSEEDVNDGYIVLDDEDDDDDPVEI
eukprot:m.92205 g.92205  ORF g.92205 m.92205 type:complete len:645 (+) comp12353_c0_seq1:82-2016(+)